MDLQQLITDQTHVSLKIAHHVATSESTPKNTISSPLSLHVILGLIAAGSSGSTRDELLSVFGSNSIDDLNKLFSEIVPLVFADGSTSGGPKLSFANGVWVDRTLPFKPEFKRVVVDLYKGSCTQVDFLNNEKRRKSFIEVNEEGTEAASASSGVIMTRSRTPIVPPKVDFVADHPFMYLIKEDTTGLVLFVGHVRNPLEN